MTKRKIFIVHPSDWLTDHLSIGDGLVAHGFLAELAERGHDIHVAARMAALRKPLPPNVTLHILPQTVGIRPLDRIEYMWRVRRLFKHLDRTVHFDVAHQMNPVFTGLSLCLARCAVPIVLGTYVPDWPDDPDAVTAGKGFAATLALRSKAIVCALQQRRAAALLLTSPAARSRIFLDAEADARIHYIQHGVDTEAFSPGHDQLDVQTCDMKILFLSNLGVKKGIFILLEAFSRVHAEFPDCRLTIAGGGKELQEICDIVGAQPWSDRVTILGAIARETAADLYRSHSLYVLPSFGEPYATTMIEAMACGKPVVTTNTGGVPYLVLPDGGLAVPPRDANALASAMIELLRVPEKAAAMGQRNRRIALEQHTWKAVVDSLENVYQQVIESAMQERPGHSKIHFPIRKTSRSHPIPAVKEHRHV